MQASSYRAPEVEAAFGAGSWQSVVFGEMRASLESKARPFPCLFGIAGLKSDQLRFAFQERLDAAWLAPVLRAYLGAARGIGPNTSLVVFSRPGPVASLESYRRRLWSLLRELAQLDSTPWPAGISERLNDPSWEFSFAGEPVFVVCNTPAHVLRQSRRASAFMVTFQPRWVFDTVFGNSAGQSKALEAIRRRLTEYDMLPASPFLGKYGEPGVLEHEQYFIGEDNLKPACPFASLREDQAHRLNSSEEAA